MSNIFSKGFVAWMVAYAICAWFIAPLVPTSWLFLVGGLSWAACDVVKSVVDQSYYS
jgi:hypothetical protein